MARLHLSICLDFWKLGWPVGTPLPHFLLGHLTLSMTVHETRVRASEMCCSPTSEKPQRVQWKRGEQLRTELFFLSALKARKKGAGGGGGNVSPPCSEQGSIALCKLNNVRFGYFWHFGRCVEMMDFMLFVEPDTDLHSVQKMNDFRFNH